MKSSLRWRILIPCAVFALLGAADTPKRTPPTVAPVVSDGVRYTAEGDGKDQFVVASDARSGQVQWEAKIFHTDVKFWKHDEEKQWVFITNLKLVKNSIFVKDEKSRCYALDITSKRVKKQKCGDTFKP